MTALLFLLPMLSLSAGWLADYKEEHHLAMGLYWYAVGLALIGLLAVL